MDSSATGMGGRPDYRAWSLDHWETALWSIYGDVATARPLTDLTLRLAEDGSHIGEAMRKRLYIEARPYFAQVLGTLFTLASRIRTDEGGTLADLNRGDEPKFLSQMVWFKFPRMCPVCAENPCQCPGKNVDALTPEQRRSLKASNAPRLAEARRTGKQPFSLDDWVATFDGIYRNNHVGKSSASKTFHFLEEVGEIELELRRADYRAAGFDEQESDWQGEVADVFSWLITVYEHIKGYADRVQEFVQKSLPGEAPSISFPSLSDILVEEYWNGERLRCPRCLAPVCREDVARR